MRRMFVLLLLWAVWGCGSGPTRPDPDNELLSGACGYSVRRGDTTRSVASDGGPLGIPVTTTNSSSAATCTWTVVMNDAARSFMTLVDPQSGSSTASQATVTLNISANTGGQRQGLVTIADVPFTITQTAATCSLTLAGDVNSSYPASGGTGRVTIARARGANCPWTAISNASFITNVAPASGTDDGAVTFTVASNGGAARTGTLTIAGQTVTVNQAAVNVVAPTITSVSPTMVLLGVTTILTVNGTGFDPATAQLVVTGPACAAGCLVPNALLTTRTPTALAGPVTLNNPGTFTVQVQNGPGAPLSNGMNVTVAATPGTAPVINAISPTQITIGTAALSITGSGFDPALAQILVLGPGCAPCVVLNGELTTRSATVLVGPVTLRAAGAFTIEVQNGSGGPPSNGITLTVIPPPTPSITGVSPTMISVGVRTSLTITGTDFDPASAQIVVVGGACSPASPCLVPNGDLTTRTTSQIVGPVTLGTAGSFTIQIQNGAAGGLSNAVTVTVR